MGRTATGRPPPPGRAPCPAPWPLAPGAGHRWIRDLVPDLGPGDLVPDIDSGGAAPAVPDMEKNTLLPPVATACQAAFEP